MKIQKYKGENEQELMKKIKDELGSSAIILNIKTIKANRFLRLFIKDQVEIIAATDGDSTTALPQVKDSNSNLEELKDKMNHMEKLLASTRDKMEDFYEESNPDQQTIRDKSKLERLIYEHLVRQEVEEEVARALLRETDDLGEDPQIQDVIRVVYNNILKIVGSPEIIDHKTDSIQGPQVIFFIGPTGVGKTTSIAKLTADFTLRKEKKVALITADTYRIAAIEQLRTYSEILSVPLKVVYSPQELQVGIEEYKDKDFIFVDTAGRSHKNNEHLEELEDMLKMFPQKKVYLVLSATTKFTDLISIVKRYTRLCEHAIIMITKTDETASAGTILNLKYFMQKPLSYVSFGQNVPDDIEIIDGGKYAKILLGSLDNE